MAKTPSYPVLDSVPDARLSEKLVTEQFLRRREEGVFSVLLGSDDLGIPDCFAFREGHLHSTIEVTAYVLGEIHDIRHVTQIGPAHYSIDLSGSFKIHSRQPHPKTLINKKIFGDRLYQRFDSEKLILLIHSDIFVSEGELSPAILGPMSLSPSFDHFSHYRNIIIDELRNALANVTTLQWDEVWLIDYTDNFDPRNATFYSLWPRQN